MLLLIVNVLLVFSLKMFKNLLANISVDTIYVTPAMLQMVQPHLHINILTQTLTTVLCISLFEVLFMLILILFRWLPANFVDHVHLVSSPISVTGIATVACACHALIKRVYHVHQTPLISPRKLVFCN